MAKTGDRSRTHALRIARPANDRKGGVYGRMGEPEGEKGRFPQSLLRPFWQGPLENMAAFRSLQHEHGFRQAIPAVQQAAADLRRRGVPPVPGAHAAQHIAIR